MQYNTLSEQLKFAKQRSIGYPNWGFIKCFNPDTLFRAYVIAADPETFPRYVRLGKFMAKTKICVVEARSVSAKNDNFTDPLARNFGWWWNSGRVEQNMDSCHRSIRYFYGQSTTT
jgi:CRISPR type I-D-associated protein Csc1